MSLAHRVACGRRHSEVRLAQTEFDHPVTCGFQFRGSLAESHGVERFGINARLQRVLSLTTFSPRGS